MASVKHKSIIDAVAEGPLVFDGAMGTQLYERGVFVNRSLEEATLSKPSLVRQIHEEYRDAGAQVLTTHTFAANRVKLAKNDLDERVAEINRSAAEIALEAANGRSWVAGSIGPTGTTPGVLSDEELERVRSAFREQVATLAEGGVHMILLETFRLLSELRIAIAAARAVTDLPIFAMASFGSDARTLDGADPERVVELLSGLDVQAVGANCVEGPRGIFAVVEKMVGKGLPVIAQPNAGYPQLRDDRLIYMATPEYFGVYARRFFKLGVAMVGGCCGTGPEHIRSIAAAARMMGGGDIEIEQIGPLEEGEDPGNGVAVVPSEEKTSFAAKVMRIHRERVRAKDPVPLTPETFAVSVEVDPPSGLDPAKALEAARKLRDGGVDVINIADGPRATVRMSNTALALLIQRELGIETLLHVCCRDRNLLGLQSDLLASHVLGLHNLVVITGDPPKLGDYPHATAVFDLDSIGLLRLIHGLNRGIDPAGKVVGAATRFFCACGAEPASLDYDREIRRLEMKRQSGAEMVMTQPVYDPETLHRFLDDIGHLDLPVLVGLFPLVSYRNAEFIHNEVPGMSIPDHIRERMRKVDKGPAARAEGVAITREALEAVADRVAGAYIIPPFHRYMSALKILEVVGFGAGEGDEP